MALVVYDRVQETTSTTGTGTITLGGAVAGYQSFAVVGNGNTTFYCIINNSAWEVGIGTYSTTGPTLARTTVLSNSNGNTSPITLVGGSSVFVTYPSEKSVNQDADGNVNILTYVPNTTTSLGTLNVGDGTYNVTLSGQIASFAGEDDVVNGINIQNTSISDTAYTALQIGADNFNTGYYLQIGTNSSTYDYAAAGYPNSSINQPNTHYILANRADLGIATWDAEDIHFIQNASTVTTDSMTLYADGGVSLGGLANPGLGNIACNNINLKFQQVLTTGGTTFLTNASPYYTQFTGTNTENLQLPDATTCLEGTTFIFDNDSTQNVDIKDGAGTTFELLVPGGFHTFVLEDNSTIAGTWLRYSQVPSAVEWGTLSLSLGATVISGGFWQGGTIQPAYGGTGLTTFAAANNALYSTGASTLTAGTLPVLAGGTGTTTSTGTAGSVVLSNNPTLAGLTDSGNLDFTGTGNRITGDFSNATTANRVAFQTSTTDSNSNLYLIPNGTATTSQWIITNSSDLSATSTGNFLSLQSNSTEGRIGASRLTASGSFVPLTFYTSNSERLRIDTSGNVGIGTTTPTSTAGFIPKLQLTSAFSTALVITSTSTTQQNIVGTNGSGLFIESVGNATGSNNNIIFRTTSSNSFFGGDERMRITSNGDVGIGTSSPSAKLQVVGSTYLSGDTSTLGAIELATLGTGDRVSLIDFHSSGTPQSIDYSCRVIRQSGVNGAFDIFNTGTGAMTFATNSAEKMRIDSSGNVGIGTSSPSTKLTVGSLATGTIEATYKGNIRIEGTETTLESQGGLEFKMTTDGYGAKIQTLSSGGTNLLFATRNASATWSERMRIDPSGNVGIGDASPGVALDVAGTVRSASATITTATTITPTAGTTNQYTVTALASAATIAIPSGTPQDGQKLTIRIKDNGTARALTWTTSAGGYRIIGTILPTTTVISKVLYVGCIYNSQDSFWDVVAVSQQA